MVCPRRSPESEKSEDVTPAQLAPSGRKRDERNVKSDGQAMEGYGDGANVGLLVGADDGAFDGGAEGVLLGRVVGDADGELLGAVEGAYLDRSSARVFLAAKDAEKARLSVITWAACWGLQSGSLSARTWARTSVHPSG